MLYIASLVLISLITGNVYFLAVFIQFSPPPTPASGYHKSDLFFHEFVLFCFFSLGRFNGRIGPTGLC